MIRPAPSPGVRLATARPTDGGTHDRPAAPHPADGRRAGAGDSSLRHQRASTGDGHAGNRQHAARRRSALGRGSNRDRAPGHAHATAGRGGAGQLAYPGAAGRDPATSDGDASGVAASAYPAASGDRDRPDAGSGDRSNGRGVATTGGNTGTVIAGRHRAACAGRHGSPGRCYSPAGNAGRRKHGRCPSHLHQDHGRPAHQHAGSAA